MLAFARILATNAVQGWKSTVLGVLILAGAGYHVYANPGVLKSDEGQASVATAVLAGLGLIGTKPNGQGKVEG